MQNQQLTPGTTVCYKCGSPTFVVIGYKGSQVTLSWFNPLHQKDERFHADHNAIEPIENFNERKIRMELKYNNRLFEVPANVDPDTIITLGFMNQEHRNKFIELMLSNETEGVIIGDSKPSSMN